MVGRVELVPESPEWWLKRLEQKLAVQSVQALRFETYYDGEQPLPIALSTEQYRKEFREMIAVTRDNWMPLVVDAKAQRLTPTGFRFSSDAMSSTGEPLTDAERLAALRPDDEAHAIWQRNHLDADAKMAHVTALTTGRCPILVWRGKDGEVEITVEHPTQMVVEYEPGSWRRVAAALKLYRDDWTGDTLATLYLPTRLHYFRRPGKGRSRQWMIRQDPIDNPLGVVPVVELRHRLRHRDGLARSVLMEVLATQDQINKTLVDTLVAAEFQAFRQRWATGVEAPINPATGKRENPFASAINRVWVTGNTGAKFGEFGQVDLSGYVGLLENRVQSIASRTATPPHYLIQGQTLPNGDSIRAAETGLVASVYDIMVPFGETWEEVISLGFRCKGDDTKASAIAETIWKDPENRSDAERADALLKRKALGVPTDQLFEDAGYSPAQIARFHELTLAEAFERAQGAKVSDVESDLVDIIARRAETLGVLIRAGATPDSAASAVGLDALSFLSGVQPVTLTDA